MAGGGSRPRRKRAEPLARPWLDRKHPSGARLLGQEQREHDYYDHQETPCIDLTTLAIAAEVETLFRDAFVAPQMEVCLGDGSFELRIRQLETWLEMQPRFGLPGYTSPPLINIRRLIRGATARLDLCNLADSILQARADDVAGEAPDRWDRMTVSELAAIAHMDEASVRNMIGKSGTKPLTSLPKRPSRRRDLYSVEVDAFDALGWLAGRRYFRPTPIDANIVAKSIPQYNPKQLGRVLGLTIWSNVGTTDIARRKLGWSAGELDGWISHGPADDMAKRTELSDLLELGSATLRDAPSRRA